MMPSISSSDLEHRDSDWIGRIDKNHKSLWQGHLCKISPHHGSKSASSKGFYKPIKIKSLKQICSARMSSKLYYRWPILCAQKNFTHTNSSKALLRSSRKLCSLRNDSKKKVIKKLFSPYNQVSWPSLPSRKALWWKKLVNERLQELEAQKKWPVKEHLSCKAQESKI